MVAHWSGGPGVVGSNPAIPTNIILDIRRYKLIGVLATIKIKDSKESKFEEIARKLVNAVNNKEEDNMFIGYIKDPRMCMCLWKDIRIKKL